LRLIGESGLEDGGVEVLADRLGVGARHLRRLFLKHLGATPVAVAQTRRLHFAKKLIDETSLSMHQVALASGFGCVRRFNAGIRKVYHRTPTQIRKLARKTEIQTNDHYVFRLNFRPPYHWQGILDFLAARATPGVEVVEGGTYRRTISLEGRDGYLEVSLAEGRDALVLRIAFGDPRSLFFIVERVRAMFDLNSDWLAIVEHLRSDPILQASVEADPGIRVPGCWNGFELAVRAILGQQITVKGATAMAGRMASRFGKPVRGAAGLTHLFPVPEVLANAPLGEIGLTGARAETIRALARAVCSGRIDFGAGTGSEPLIARLCEISGIGKWTAQYVAMRALGEPDAFPSSDLGLLRAMDLESARDLELRAEAWRPWRAYAAMYLWSIYSQSSNRESRAAPDKKQNVAAAITVPHRPVPIAV
jgi:AraC family transcriptional regulator of adaptative response / DNA-3-methyladenine glycosylase II